MRKVFVVVDGVEHEQTSPSHWVNGKLIPKKEFVDVCHKLGCELRWLEKRIDSAIDAFEDEQHCKEYMETISGGVIVVRGHGYYERG